tara:strand:+ start:2199 stop:2528 length:330 start_codon:yes stop_codon:yes gene_type:complete
MIKKKETYKPLPDYISIGSSEIHGAGLFAVDDIPKEIEIGISHAYDPNFLHDYIRTPLGGFINHSEKPNCELIEDDENTDYKKIKTIKKIEQGEELTLKYSLYEICDYL